MLRLSTREAAKRLGISYEALANYIRVGKVSTPETARHGQRTIHLWTEAEIEHVHKLLPKIKNGRKTRYQKKKNKPQAKRPVPHKKK